MVTRNNIIECLLNVGCVVEDNVEELINVIDDSVMYVSFIVELEEMFGIEIPDDYLFVGAMNSISSICDILNEILETQRELLF